MQKHAFILGNKYTKRYLISLIIFQKMYKILLWA